jgi:hypothetical protein
MRVPRCCLVVATLVLTPLAPRVALQASDANSAAGASMDRKLQHVQQNGALAHPDPTPTEFTEQEVNAYLAAGRVKLPAGVQSVHFQSQPDVVTATTRVDFEQIKAGRNSSNPLLSMFKGVHDVVVVAHARGMGHQGYVQVDSVALDGVEIPRFILELFVEKYLQPKYPGIGMNSQFALPTKIDTATVGLHKLTVTQK